MSGFDMKRKHLDFEILYGRLNYNVEFEQIAFPVEIYKNKIKINI